MEIVSNTRSVFQKPPSGTLAEQQAKAAARTAAEAAAAATAAQKVDTSWITERIAHRNQVAASRAYGRTVTLEDFAKVVGAYVAAYNKGAGVSDPLTMSEATDTLTITQENGDVVGTIRFFHAAGSPAYATFTTPAETGRVEIRDRSGSGGLSAAALESRCRFLIDRILFPDLAPLRQLVTG